MGGHAETKHLDTSATVGLDSMESNVKVSFHVSSVLAHSISLGGKKMPSVFRKLFTVCE